MNYEKIDQNLKNVKDLCYEMLEIADHGDKFRKDSGCGAIYGSLRDAAYKLRKLVDKELELHKLEIQRLRQKQKKEESNESKEEDSGG